MARESGGKRPIWNKLGCQSNVGLYPTIKLARKLDGITEQFSIEQTDVFQTVKIPP